MCSTIPILYVALVALALQHDRPEGIQVSPYTYTIKILLGVGSKSLILDFQMSAGTLELYMDVLHNSPIHTHTHTHTHKEKLTLPSLCILYFVVCCLAT